MAVSTEELERIAVALERAGATYPCPRCGGTHFSPLNGYISEVIQENLSYLQVGGTQPTIHTVVMVCDQCGYMAQHAMRRLGLNPALHLVPEVLGEPDGR